MNTLNPSIYATKLWPERLWPYPMDFNDYELGTVKGEIKLIEGLTYFFPFDDFLLRLSEFCENKTSIQDR